MQSYLKSRLRIMWRLWILSLLSANIILISVYFACARESMNQNENEDIYLPRQLHVLVCYYSNDEYARAFEKRLNYSLPVELWDISTIPFPNDPIILTNYSLVILDQSVSPHHLNSSQTEAIWSSLKNGSSFLFNYQNSKIYFDKFNVTNTRNKTNYLWLTHNHHVLAPSFLYSAGTSWKSSSLIHDIPFYINTSVLPCEHKILLNCKVIDGAFSNPMVIYGKYGKGKFSVITGQLHELENLHSFGMRWVRTRVVFWLLPNDQPLRYSWSNLGIAFRDDDLGGNWAGSLENQVGNMSMALSWRVPMTWSFACEDNSREIWSNPLFIEKIKELEDSGHEIFLHCGGYAKTWQNYNYSKARERIEGLMKNYEEVLGHPPKGWVTSQHGYTDIIIKVLEDLGFKYNSENRESGRILLNDIVLDASGRYYIKSLNAYKDYIDSSWLFGPRNICFISHFYIGDIIKINQWIDDFKIFLANYEHKWITLDQYAHIVHGQPYAHITNIKLLDKKIILKVISNVDTILYVELKNNTISNVIKNEIPVFFKSQKSFTTKLYGKKEIILKIGKPKKDVKIIYSDIPPSSISYINKKIIISFYAPQGRNITSKIFIPYKDNWSINCTELIWYKKWDPENGILTVWTVSDGTYDIIINNLRDIISPIANAGEDKIIDEDTFIIFNGLNSYDNVGIISYKWKFTDIDLIKLNGSRPTYIFSTPGTYTITLNISDASGNWDTDVIDVKVLDTTSPEAIAGPDQTVSENSNVIFNASRSSDNVEIVKYEWDFGDELTGRGEITTHNYPKAGIYIVTLTINDAAGNIKTDSLNVIVEPRKKCIIVTVTYGSELSPQVEYLRFFRDNIVLNTFSGKNFMTVFNIWYYSFSPHLALKISENNCLRIFMKFFLLPLFPILRISMITYSLFSFNPELGIVISGLFASSFIGIIYFAPFILFLKIVYKRELQLKILHIKSLIWLLSIVSIALAEVIKNKYLMMFSTGSLILVTLSLAAHLFILVTTDCLRISRSSVKYLLDFL